MKKAITVLLIFTLCLLPAFSIFAGESNPGNSSYLYQASVYDTGSEGLGLKANPDINSQRYMYIPDGTQLYIDQISGNWGHTVYNGTGGWIALRYTRVIGDYRSQSPSYGQIFPAYYIVHDTEGEGLEQRLSPSGESSTFGPAYDGAVALVTAIQNDWAYASCNGHYGWMNLTYLSPWNASASNYQVYVYDTKGNGLSLKASPDTGSGSYMAIPEGTALYIDNIVNGYGHTHYNNTDGWVELRNTRIEGNYPSQIPSGSFYSQLIQYRVVNTEGEGLELRTGPGTSYSTFGPLYDGTVVYVHTTLNDWAYVYCNGHFGWANLTYLTQLQGSAGTVSAPAQPDQSASGPVPSSSGQLPSGPSSPSENNIPALPSTAKNPEAASPSAQTSADGIIVSANIAEYNGITYMLPRNNNVNGLSDLPVTPALYSYVCSFAFYNNRIYYCSKQAGTSDYSTALCTCLPDGTDQKILLDSAQAGDSYHMTSFVINDNKIYFTQFSSGSTVYCCYDINADALASYADPGPEVKDRLENMRNKVTDGSETYYTGNSNRSGSSGNALYYKDANGNEILLATSDLSLSIEAITSDCVYFSKFNSGNAELYRVFRDTLAVEYLDGHMAVGGGIYFNW